jgi:hypothetical protein
MHQILRGTIATAELEIYSNGRLINADGDVTLTIVDADYSDVILGENLVAYNDPAIGRYTFDLDSTYTNLNRILMLTWSYEVNGKSTYQEDYYEVYTPYASVSEIISYYDFGTRPSDVNYRSETEIAAAEKIARLQIEGYAGQAFGRAWGQQEIFGNGSDALELVQRMISVERLYENGRLVIDYTTDPVVNTFGWNVELTPTNRAIRILNQDYNNFINYDNQIDPVNMYVGRFRDRSRYMVYGELGWTYVPSDVSTCAKILAGDYLAQDSQWRNKYLKKINLSEISFELAGGAFNGTGNVIVDGILDSYRNTGIVII